MTADGITETVLRGGEKANVAFVDSVRDPDAVARHVCALLNGEGGIVLVGVGDRRTADPDVTERRAEELRAFLHEQVSPPVLFTVSMDNTPHGDVITVDVPTGRDRPYIFDGTILVRIGKRTARATAEAVREMVEVRAWEPERWERRLATGLELDELERSLIDEVVRRAQEKRGHRFDDPQDHEQILTELSLSRLGQLTNAADVLFGRRVALRHPQTRMRAVCYETNKANRFIDEQLFEGPASKLLDDAMAFLRRHVGVSAEFEPGRLERDSRPQYPWFSLREGLVNALVHRDYASFSGGVSISIFPRRIEILNSGSLPKGMSQKELRRQSHNSYLVNPDIGHVFYLHELMERVGRGTYLIVQQCREMGMRLPEWKSDGSTVRLIFHAAGSGGIELNERQIALLGELAVGQRIRTREFMERFGTGVSQRQIRRDLGELRDAGFLRRVGSGPATAYERLDRQP